MENRGATDLSALEGKKMARDAADVLRGKGLLEPLERLAQAAESIGVNISVSVHRLEAGDLEGVPGIIVALRQTDYPSRHLAVHFNGDAEIGNRVKVTLFTCRPATSDDVQKLLEGK